MLPSSHILAIVINAVFVKVLLTFPKTVVENSANAAWIQILYVSVIAFLFFTAITKMYNIKKNIIEATQIKYGKIAKIVVGIITLAVLIANFFPTIRIYPETVKTILLKDTNTEIIIIAMAVAVIVGAMLGIEAIARIHRIFLPIAVVIIIFFVVFLIPFCRKEYITPVFGNGIKKVFFNGLNGLSLFSDLIILNLLIPYCKNMEVVRKCTKISIIVTGLSATAITLIYCLTFSYPASENFIIPMYQMARLVHLSSFFSRFEAFFEFVWSIMILLYSSMYLFMICYTVQITFSLKYLKPLILPMGVIVFMISLLPDSVMDMLEIEKTIITYSFIPVFTLFLVFGIICKKMEKI